MALDYKHWILTHLVWIALAAGLTVAFYSWRGEHDARLIAEAKVKADETQVASLQQSIIANAQQIAALQTQMEARDAAAAKQLAAISSLVSKVQTPDQAVRAFPQVSSLPVAPTVQGDSVVFPSQDIVPLFQQLAQGKQDGINLVACTADLKDEKSVAAKQSDTITTQVKQIGLKDDEIKALKQPKSFWQRAGGIAKAVGVGIGIGLLLGHHI